MFILLLKVQVWIWKIKDEAWNKLISPTHCLICLQVSARSPREELVLSFLNSHNPVLRLPSNFSHFDTKIFTVRLFPSWRPLTLPLLPSLSPIKSCFILWWGKVKNNKIESSVHVYSFYLLILTVFFSQYFDGITFFLKTIFLTTLCNDSPGDAVVRQGARILEFIWRWREKEPLPSIPALPAVAVPSTRLEQKKGGEVRRWGRNHLTGPPVL